jgi:tetratricopeptide (TPR) repeat protein
MSPGTGPLPPISQRLALAMQHHQAGRLADAEALYRGILQESPQHPHALHLLGVLAHQAGRPRDAIDLINRALAVHGPHPVFYSNLGAIHLALGLLPETVAYCREAVRLQPNLADAHNNLGLALLRQGQYDEAEAALRAALRVNRGHLDARCNLGAILHRQGRLNEALALLQETVRLAPNFAQARNDLGGALLACGQPEPAIEHLQEAVRLRPDFAEAQSNLGLAFRELGRIDEAVRCFRGAMRLNPAYPGAHNNLGYTLEFQGQVEEARAEFREALRLDPNNARALASLSGLAAAGHYQLSDEELSRIRSLLTRNDLPADDLGRLHFALARVHDKAGDYDKAFVHYRQGNDFRKEYVRRRGAAFDPEAQRRAVDRLIAAFTPAYFERVRSFGADGELPIFVVGMMRSGTSLAEQILASHPDVYGAGELRDIDLLVNALPQHLGAAEGYPDCLARLDAAAARGLAEGHLKRLRERGGAAAARVVDKAPFNFLHLGVIATLFPKARIIHCRRDPVDTCLSCYFQNFGEPLGFSLDLRHLGLYYREYERLIAHWAAVLPVRVFDLCYEELTADQEAVSRRMVAFCGLDWDDRCLRFHETRRPVRTASTLQVRRPMYRSAVGRWKRYEAHLGPLLEALGDRGTPGQ